MVCGPVDGAAVDVKIDNVQLSLDAPADVPGCTDMAANNYNPDATVDDGSCTYGGGTAMGGSVPEVVILAADGSMPDLEAGVDFTGYTAFGSGSILNASFSGDSSYGNAMEVTVGAGYGGGALAQLGIEGFADGFAGGYDELLFKVKGLDADNTIVVKLEEPFPGATSPVTVNLAMSDMNLRINPA